MRSLQPVFKLVVALFSAEEFSVWAGLRYRDVLDSLGLGRNPSTEHLVFIWLDALQRRQRIDAAFFAGLVEVRAQAAADIGAVARDWLGVGAKVSAGDVPRPVVVIVCHGDDVAHRIDLQIHLMGLQNGLDFTVWHRSGVFFQREAEELERVRAAAVIEVLTSASLFGDREHDKVLEEVEAVGGGGPLVHVTHVAPYLPGRRLSAFVPRPNQPLGMLRKVERAAHWVTLCGEIQRHLTRAR